MCPYDVVLEFLVSVAVRKNCCSFLVEAQLLKNKTMLDKSMNVIALNVLFVTKAAVLWLFATEDFKQTIKYKVLNVRSDFDVLY